MSNKLILRTQANEVFQVMNKLGLNKSEFKWEEHDSDTPDGDYYKVSKLVHVPTGYYFVFDYDYDSHYGIRSPGNNKAIESNQTRYWPQQLDYAKQWLQLLKREIEAPDLWNSMTAGEIISKIALASDSSNSPFSPPEQIKLEEKIKQIEILVSDKFALIKEQSEFVDKKLDYLIDSAKRQGRFDWLHTAIGVVFTIIFGLQLDSQQARELLDYIIGSINDLFSGMMKLP